LTVVNAIKYMIHLLTIVVNYKCVVFSLCNLSLVGKLNIIMYNSTSFSKKKEEGIITPSLFKD